MEYASGLELRGLETIQEGYSFESDGWTVANIPVGSLTEAMSRFAYLVCQTAPLHFFIVVPLLYDTDINDSCGKPTPAHTATYFITNMNFRQCDKLLEDYGETFANDGFCEFGFVTSDPMKQIRADRMKTVTIFGLDEREASLVLDPLGIPEVESLKTAGDLVGPDNPAIGRPACRNGITAADFVFGLDHDFELIKNPSYGGDPSLMFHPDGTLRWT
ncbi:Uncharacterised protein [Slackia heliotrinireducens]|uniref:hypothetical protein n=1 Tax=Slackia heliotrinireducens TaxID=84110 RepID=UPI0001A3682F|nr:hypothetical protein [Slackia heliotrinireducens]VEH00276.1 Uncharacterised protein [Slackia heliotrinireducens]